MALTATDYVEEARREIGDASKGVIKTFRAAAGINYKAGDFVTVDTDGRLVLQGTDQTAIDGIVAVNVDNTLGANDAKTVPVIVKGNVWVDFLVADSTYLPIAIGTQCTIAGDGGTTTAEGQSVANISSATVLPFTSLSVQAATLTATKKKGLFFFKGNGVWE